MTQSNPSIEITDASTKSRDRWLIALLAVAVFALYLPTRHFGFVGYDDYLYVYENLHVQQGLSADSIRWAMSAIVVANWHPLTILTELTIVQFFGPGAGAFHMVNALLHTLSVILLFQFLRSATGRLWPAFFTAALWGLHPLRVESVAWISELKDVLCGSLWLGCMLAYLHYSRNRTFGRYAVVFLLQALALLAKPMAVTLPAVLLLLDIWPLNQPSQTSTNPRGWPFRILEKLPLLAVCIGDTLFAIRTQTSVRTDFSPKFPLGLNIQNGLNAYLSYLRDIFVPAGLHYFYPHPAMMNQTISIFSTACCAVALIGITLATLGRLKTQPYLCVGWLWFLGSLIPVIGLVHFGEQARADRYTYLPSIGITFAIVYAIADFTTRRVSLRPLAIAAGAAACVALAVISSILIPSWKSTDALVSRALEIQPDNYLALLMRAKDLRLANNIPAALKYAEEAVHASPKSNGAHIAYGMALEASGRLEEAFQEFQISSEIDPAEPEAWEGMGSVRDLQADRLTGKDPKGEIDFRQKASVNFAKAIQFNPDAVESREYLAFELARLGYIDAAIEQWEKLVKLKPDYVRGQGDLADALLMKGDYTGAAEHYRMAIAGKARKHEWESKLAYLVATDPQYSPADVQPMIAIARDAVDQTNEQDADALDAYAACLARVGVFDLAKDAAQKALARAQAVHDATLSKSIQKRLAKYEQFKPYLIGDDPKPASTTQSTSRPVEPAAK